MADAASEQFDVMTPKADILAMLLSSDWFFEKWWLLGLHASPNEKRQLQKLCRQIVKQILGDAKQYWLVSFSEERKSVTSRMLFGAVSSCGLADSFAARIRELADGKGKRESKKNFDVLFSATTEALIARPPQALPTSVIESVEHNWRIPVSEELDSIETLAERSRTPWDTRMRSLTPDLPAYLPDWVVTICNQTSQCRKFWNSLVDSLSSADRTTLIQWYVAEARELAGAEFHPPIWMR
jgi:hypothetical protein